METAVLVTLHERRRSARLASIIDDALDLAEECGWRYAIAYLISEKVPSPIIQRLLFGGAGVRRTPKVRRDSSPVWNGSNAEDMKNLFDWLRQRRSAATCDRDKAPVASRASVRHADIE